MENSKKNKKTPSKIQNKKKITIQPKDVKQEKEETKTPKVKRVVKRKNIDPKNLIILLGVIVLLIIFLIVLFNSRNKDNALDVLEEKGDQIDLTEKEDFAPEKFLRDYIKCHNVEQKNIVYYDIPEKLSYAVQDSEFNKQYFEKGKNVNYSIVANVFYNISADDLIDKYQEITSENEYIKSSYSILKSKENNVKILKFDYVNNVKNEPELLYTGQEIYFVLEIDGGDTFSLEYKLIDQKMSDRLLNEIANGIEVDNNKGNYLVLTKNNSVLTGSLKSIDRYYYELYNFNIKIDADKYVEVEDSNNSYNQTTLKNKENNEIVTIKTSYNNLSTIKKSISNVIETKVTINNKEFTKLYNNEKTHYIYITDNKNTYEVILNTNGKSKIEDFTNFTVEKVD